MGHKACKIELALCFTAMLCDSSMSVTSRQVHLIFIVSISQLALKKETKFSQTHVGPRGLRAQFKADSLRNIKVGKLKQTGCSWWQGGLRPF